MRFIKEAALLIFLFALTSFIYQRVSYPKRLKNTIQHEIAVNLGLQSKIDKVKVNFFRGEIKIKNAYIKNPNEDFENEYFAEIQGIYAKFSPIAFFRKEIILDEVVIFSPKFYLEENSKQKNNFDIVYGNTMHYRNPKPAKYFTVRDLEIRNLEILQAQDNSKAHNIAELLVKNIGAQDGGLSCSKLSYQFFDILSQRALKQYATKGKVHFLNTTGRFVRSEINNRSELVLDSADEVEQCDSDFAEVSAHEILEEIEQLEENSDDLEESEPMACPASKEVSEIMTENEVEVLELESAIGLEVVDSESASRDTNLDEESTIKNYNAVELNKASLIKKYRDFYDADDATF